MDVADQTDKSRYFGLVEGHEIKIDYKLRGDRIFLVHTEVPDALSGQGIGRKLVEHALKDIAHRDLELVPMCPFVKTYLKRHPEWNDLISII